MEAILLKKVLVVCVVILVGIGSNGVFLNAQPVMCNMTSAGLMACRPSVTANPRPPSSDCCTALSHADLRCLCSYKNSNLLPSLGIDPNLAMQLPAKCNLPRPSNC